MDSFIVNFVDLNQGINFDVLLSCLLIYMVLFWGAISVWVYFDAVKHFESKSIPYIAAILVFILSFPALILYLLVRGEVFDSSDLHYELENLSIPSIPIADITDENKKKFRIELSFIPYSGEILDESSKNSTIDTQVVKADLVEFMKDKLNTSFHKDKKIKNLIQKLLELLQNRNKYNSQDDGATADDEFSKSSKKKKKHKKKK